MNGIDYLSSPMCMRLALALAHFLWQGLVIVLLGLLVAKLFGRNSSRIRYTIYVVSLFAMVLFVCMTYALTDVSAKAVAEETGFEAAKLSVGPQEVGHASEMTLPRTHEPLIGVPSIEPPPETAMSEAMEPVSVAKSWSSFDCQACVPYAVTLYGAGVFVMLGRLLIGLQGGRQRM